MARGEKHLGAEIGFFGVLHTWTQSLEFHPHVHFVVPGGGLSKGQWVAKRGKKFFLPVKVLSQVFRGKFIEYLKRVSARGQIEVENLEAFLNKACRTPWVVYLSLPLLVPRQF